MSKLFKKLELKNLTVKNRLVMSPMCQYSAHDGFANDWHFVHYGTRAVGGIGTLIQEATAVSPQGRITYKDLGIWKDEHILELGKIINFVHHQGSLIGIQLAHAGRKASVPVEWEEDKTIIEGYNSWEIVGPSKIPFDENSKVPHELRTDQIEIIIQDFKSATIRAIKAGYDIIEIHAAHGYLIHEFLSPLSNHRTDEYGGSFENRIRLLTQIISEILPLLTQKHSLWVRISATDWVENGWNLEESIKLAKVLKSLGVEIIDVSTGGNIATNKIIPVHPNYQVPFAAQIKKQASILTGTVGLITEAFQCEEILEKEEANLIFLGRELLRNPYFALNAEVLLDGKANCPFPYERAYPKY